MEKEVQEAGKKRKKPRKRKTDSLPKLTQVASKKIRFYPEKEDKYHQATSLYRRAYNMAIGMYQEDFNLLSEDIRPEIIREIRDERSIWDGFIDVNLIQDAVAAAKITMFALFREYKKTGKMGSPKFKKRKSKKQMFASARFPKSDCPIKSGLGKTHLTEKIPSEAYGKSYTVSNYKGRWYLLVQQHVKTTAEIQGKVKMIAIDPGVRTFATCYSESEALIAGEDFAKEKLYPLMRKVDNLLKERAKIERLEFYESPDWVEEKLKGLNKKINRLSAKKDDILLDLHHRLAHYLVMNYDVIFLPKFETQKLVLKKGEVRKIRRMTARQMLSLGHFQFRQRLEWYGKKYGKHIALCNESYTSKTRCWDGVIDDKLGSKKTITDGEISVDRDINGARGILLKQLSQVA